jgi:hypothetical protein
MPALALAMAALPATAGAESIVPPSNSAAAQYTEAFPTAGGEKQVSGRKNKKRTPAKVLGGHDAHKLESKGKQGREVADFAAETSPASTPEVEPNGEAPEANEVPAGSKSSSGGKKKDGHPEEGAGGSGQGGGSPPGKNPNGGGGTAGTAHPSAGVSEPSGSSGLGEVIGQATGSSSSGQLGFLLPLALVAAVVWALVFYWRQRRRRIA